MIYRIIILMLLTLVTNVSQGQVLKEKDFQEIMMLWEQNNPEKAIAKIETLRKSVSVNDSMYGLLLMTSAEINMKAFNYEQAIKDNAELIGIMPEVEIDCQSLIGLLKKYLGEFEGSINAYRRIIELKPDNEIVYFNLASVYVLAKEYEKAIFTLKSNPNKNKMPPENYLYALSYYYLNEIDSAKIYIDKYIGTNESSQDYIAYKVAAQIYLKLNKKIKSCELIKKANDIITNNNMDNHSKNKEKQEQYWFFKYLSKEIQEINEFKTLNCN